MVEREAIDVILRRPRARAVGLAQRVKLLAKRVERMPARVLEALQERGARHRHRHHPYQHPRVVGCLLVGLATLLPFLPLLLALAGNGILLVQLALPHIDGILTHTLVRSLLATDNRHQSQVVLVAVAILHSHPVGVGRGNGKHRAEHRHVHRHGNTHKRLLQPYRQQPDVHFHARLLGHHFRILHLIRRDALLECTHYLLHHLRHALGLLLASRVNHTPQLRFRESEAGHHRHEHLFLIVADGSEIHRQLVQFHVALALLWFATRA